MTIIRREKFEWLSIKVGIFFSRIVPIGPNAWTLLSLVPAFLAFVSLVSRNFVLAAIFFAIAAFADVIDGAVARVTGRVTRKGAYLDTIVDRYVEFLVLLGFLFVFPSFWVIFALFGSMITTYSKAAAAEKLETEVKGGIIGRVERLILLLLTTVFLNVSYQYAFYLLVALGVLSNVSAIQRILAAIKSA